MSMLSRQIVGTIAILVAAAAPFVASVPLVAAWDDPNKVLPCGAVEKLATPFGATARYDKTGKTSVEVIRFLDAEKKPVDGHAWRHYYSTTVEGGLTFKVNSTNVEIKAPKCPVQPPAEEPREYVPCFTDPLIPYDKRHGYSTRFLNDKHTEGVVIIYLDRERVESLGRAVLHPFWTKDTRYKGRNYTCELKFKGVTIDGEDYVSVTSVAIRNPDKTD